MKKNKLIILAIVILVIILLIIAFNNIKNTNTVEEAKK